jgi:Holliday junction resolvase
MYAKKTDINHQAIREAMRDYGAVIFDSSAVGRGFPDLVCGYAGVTALVEIKASSKSKFTEDQLKFIKNWKGGILARVEDVDSAIRLLKTMENKNDEKS